jgi:hypothetical protein
MRKQVQAVMTIACVVIQLSAGVARAGDGRHFPAGDKAGASLADSGQVKGDSLDRCRLHGGLATATEHHCFETILGKDKIRVYLYTRDQTPMMVESARGTLTLTLPDGSTQKIPLVSAVPEKDEVCVYFCPSHVGVVQTTPGICTKCGSMVLYKQNRLVGKIDPALIGHSGLTATVQVTRMGKPETEATFTAVLAEAVGSGQPQESGQRR